MIEKKSNRKEMTDGFELQALTEDLLKEVNGGLMSYANTPAGQLAGLRTPPTTGPNLGDYADWYYNTYGFGGTGGNSMNGGSPAGPWGRPA